MNVATVYVFNKKDKTLTAYGYTDDKVVNGYKFFKAFPFETIIRNDNLNLIAV